MRLVLVFTFILLASAPAWGEDQLQLSTPETYQAPAATTHWRYMDAQHSAVEQRLMIRFQTAQGRLKTCEAEGTESNIVNVVQAGSGSWARRAILWAQARGCLAAGSVVDQ